MFYKLNKFMIKFIILKNNNISFKTYYDKEEVVEISFVGSKNKWSKNVSNRKKKSKNF